MKKKIITSILLMMIPFLVQAKTITKEDLIESIEYMVACDMEGNYTELPYGIDMTESGPEPAWELHKCKTDMDYTGVEAEYEITDDTITLYDVTYNYSLEDDGSAIFSLQKEIISGPGAHNKYFSFDDGFALLYGYYMIAKAYGVEPYDAEAYFYDLLDQSDFYTYIYTWGESYGEYILLKDDTDYDGNLIVVNERNFDNYAMEVARAIGGSETRTMDDKDSLNTLSFTFDPDDSDPDKYKLSYTLKVTPTNNFLGVKNYIEGPIIDDDSSNNSLPPEEVEEETPVEEVTKDTSTTENPDTGLFLNIVGIITILTIGLVIVLKNKSVFKKI